MGKSTGLVFAFFLLPCLQCSSEVSPEGDGGPGSVDESDFEEAGEIALQAEAQYTLFKQSAASLAEAREQTVSWLLEQEAVTEAGVEEDEKTIWFFHASGLTSGVLTENSFNNTTTQQFDFSGRESIQGLSANAADRPKATGMMAWLLSPFYTENATHDQIYALSDFYEVPGFGPMFPPLIDEEANIAAFQAAIMGFLPPAVHFTVISHGGRTRLKKGAKKVSHILSGEYKTPTTWSLYAADFKADRLVTKAYKGKLWLTMTPAFFEHYSAEPSADSAHWMARYVFLLVCYSYRDNGLHDAFMNNGARAFSGFTRGVDVEWGNNISVEYFEKLAEREGRTMAEARGAISGTVDPDNPRCTFEQSAKTVDTRYFFRASVVVDGNVYLTPSYAWLAVFDDEIPKEYYFRSTVFHETTGEMGGDLIVIFDSTAGGNVTIEDTVTEIRFETTDATWGIDHTYWEEFSLHGVVIVPTFNDINGGQVLGSFDGTLTDSLTNPTGTKQIGGNFELIRSK